jgi:hypothetical protein
MANFGWAYINCSDTGSSGATVGVAPAGAVQFVHGTGSMTGSARFRYLTGAYGEHTGSSTLVLSGNMVITGALSASLFHYESIAVIDATGSTFFGNSRDDRHFRTGSLTIWGYSGSTDDQPTSILSASAYSRQVFVKGFGGGYRNVTSSHYTASTENYILGIATPFTGGTDPVRLTIPSASLFGTGGMLIIKDEASNRGGSSIVITRSVTDDNTIDGAASYTLTGTMPAISLYSNGSNWFVF